MYCSGKLQRFPTQRNNNSVSNGSVLVSREGEANKEAACPAYCTEDCVSIDGVLNVLLYTLCQRQTTAAAAAGSRNRKACGLSPKTMSLIPVGGYALRGLCPRSPLGRMLSNDYVPDP